MNRAIIITGLLIGLSFASLSAQTDVSGSIVGETWTKAESPYRVVGDINVKNLTIQQGAAIHFTGNHLFEITGRLIASGSKEDTIIFSALPGTDIGWPGLEFKESITESQLRYVRIADSDTAAVEIRGANVTLEHLTLNRNNGHGLKLSGISATLNRGTIKQNAGHGIILADNAHLSVYNSIINANEQIGVNIENGDMGLENSIVANNGQGGVFIMSAGMALEAVNSVIAYNQGTGVFAPSAQANLLNSIIYGNTNQVGGSTDNIEIRYSNVEGTFDGVGNINVNPAFSDTTRTFQLTEQSPCIDGGDPNVFYNDRCFPPSKGGVRNDMGAYGGKGASLWFEPLYVKPDTLDFGNVTVDSTKRRIIRIKNYRDTLQTIENLTPTGGDSLFFMADTTQWQLAPFDSAEVGVSFRPTKTGVFSQTQLEIISDLDQHIIPLLGRGVVSDIFLETSTLKFGLVRVNETKDRLLNIFNVGSDTLRIWKFLLQPPFYLADEDTLSTIAPFKNDSITIGYQPDTLGTIRDSLIILSNDPDEGETVVDLQAEGTAPLIEIDKDTVRFERVWARSDSSLSVITRNTGTADLHINEVKLSANLNPEHFRATFSGRPLPLRLSAGDTAHLNLRFAPDSIGVTEGLVRIISDAWLKDTLDITLQARSVASVIDFSERTISFNDTRIDSQRTRNVTVSNTGNALLRVDSVSLESNASESFSIAADVFPMTIDTASQGESLDIVFKPREPGALEAKLQFYSNDPLNDSTFIMLYGKGIAPAAQLSHSALDFGSVLVGSDSSRTLSISNTGNEPLKIDSLKLTGTDTAFYSWQTDALPATIAADDEPLGIQLTYAPVDTGVSLSQLHIYSNDPQQNDKSIALTGYGVRPILYPGETELAFGTHPVSGDTTILLPLENIGNTTLNISNMEILGADSSAFLLPDGNDPLIILPGGKDTLSIRFAPTTGGSKQATLRLYSNDPFEKTQDIILSARAGIANLRMSRSAIDFGRIQIGQSHVISVNILNNGDAYARIDSIILSGEDASAFMLSAPDIPFRVSADGDSQNIHIQFQPDRPGLKDAQLVINSFNTLNVDLKGTAIFPDAPYISSSDTTIDFNSPFINETVERRIHLFNFGALELQIDSAGISGAHASQFQLLGPELPAAVRSVDDSLMLTLQYQPIAAGEKEAQLDLFYNDASRSPFRIKLYGGANVDETPAQFNMDTSALVFNYNEDTLVEVGISDAETEIAQVRMYLRRAGEPDFDEQIMQSGANSIWSATVSGAFVTERGLEYYFEADHGGRTSVFPEGGKANPLGANIHIEHISFPTATVPTLYQMISIPLQTGGQDLRNLFTDDLGNYDSKNYRVFTWDHQNETFEELNNLDYVPQPGRAVWLVTRDSILLDLENVTSVPTTNPYSIHLHEGWNMIATPFAFDVDWQSVSQWMTLYHYNGNGWVNASVMEPFEGYAVKAIKDTTISIIPLEADTTQALQKTQRADEEDAGWRIQLIAERGRFRDEHNFAGARINAKEQWDKNDAFEPPGVDRFVSLYFDRSDWQPYPDRYNTDIRALNQEGYEYDFTIKSNINGRTTLTVKSEQLPDSYDWVIVSPATGVKYDGQEIHIDQENQRFILIVGSEKYISGSLEQYRKTPETFEIQQNYPNPFNQSTAVEYQLPEPTDVAVFVYDILGRKVATLTKRQTMEAGYYTVHWDGNNGAGFPVSSGIYFLVVQSGIGNRTIKMVLKR